MTRTHTLYFSEESVKGLHDEFMKLSTDWNERRGFVYDSRLADAVNRRLMILHEAINLLTERTD